MHVYDKASVSILTGETESYDNAFFPRVIRRRELELIQQVLRKQRPKFILDYGCGGGWLSRLLFNWGFRSIGMDISKNMAKNAKIVCRESDFVVCDAMRLPFKNDIFDFIFGISILHHLDLKQAINELKRISVSETGLLFMEPNLLNPLSAFGRKVFPMEAHTKGEEPYTPEYLKTALNLANLCVERYFAIFFVAFPAARFSRISRLNTPPTLVRMTYFFERLMEKIPGIRYLNSNIVAIARLQK